MATRRSQIADTERGSFDRCHNGGYVIGGDENHGRILSWILEGAPRGERDTPLPADAPDCVG